MQRGGKETLPPAHTQAGQATGEEGPGLESPVMPPLFFDDAAVCTDLFRFLTRAVEIRPIEPAAGEDHAWLSPFVSLARTCKACATAANEIKKITQNEALARVEHHHFEAAQGACVTWRGPVDLQLPRPLHFFVC